MLRVYHEVGRPDASRVFTDQANVRVHRTCEPPELTPDSYGRRLCDASAARDCRRLNPASHRIGGRHPVRMDYRPRARAEMREPRKRGRLLADAAAVALALGSFFAPLLFGKYWKVGLILLVVLGAVGLITGLLILWVNRWDI